MSLSACRSQLSSAPPHSLFLSLSVTLSVSLASNAAVLDPRLRQSRRGGDLHVPVPAKDRRSQAKGGGVTQKKGGSENTTAVVGNKGVKPEGRAYSGMGKLLAEGERCHREREALTL